METPPSPDPQAPRPRRALRAYPVATFAAAAAGVLLGWIAVATAPVHAHAPRPEPTAGWNAYAPPAPIQLGVPQGDRSRTTGVPAVRVRSGANGEAGDRPAETRPTSSQPAAPSNGTPTQVGPPAAEIPGLPGS